MSISLSILTNAGIWKYLSNIDIPAALEDEKEAGNLMIICLCLGLLMTLVFFIALKLMGLLYGEPEIEEHELEHDKENNVMCSNLQVYGLSSAQDDLITQKIEEIRKLRSERLEKDAANTKLKMEYDVILKQLQERDKESTAKIYHS